MDQETLKQPSFWTRASIPSMDCRTIAMNLSGQPLCHHFPKSLTTDCFKLWLLGGGPCVSLNLWCFVVYSARRIVVCLNLCQFVLVFYSPFSIAITSLGEERANLSAFRMFDRFVLVWICRFPLPLDVWEGLRFVIVALPGLFSFLFLVYKFRKIYSCNDFSTQFRYKKIGYNINVIRQTACMVDNPITVNNFASLFNCTPAG